MVDTGRALEEYHKKSIRRRVSDHFCIRMSPELVQKYDDGVYNYMLEEHASCIEELVNVFGDIFDKQAIFYTYLIPDDKVEQLLGFSGGHPVQAFDDDGFPYACGFPQNFFIMNGYGKKPDTPAHVNFIHEYAHLIQECRGLSKHRIFREGFAEVVPWYILDYELKWPEHGQMVAETEIYSANDLLTKVGMSKEDKPGRRCMFQKTYISAYALVRTILEKMEKKFAITKKEAVKLYLSIYSMSPNTNQDKLGPNLETDQKWLIAMVQDSFVLLGAFAKMLDLDADKLLYTTEYQKEVLQKMRPTGKINVPPREIIR